MNTKVKLTPQDVSEATKYWKTFRKLPIGNAEMIMHLTTFRNVEFNNSETPTPKQLENTVMELTLKTLKNQMDVRAKEKDYDGRFDLFIASIDSCLNPEK